MAARKPTPKAAAEQAAVTPPPATDTKAANELAAEEQAVADAKAAEELAAKEQAAEAAFQAEKVEEEHEFLILEPVLHNSKKYMPGAGIKLTAGYAESLIKRGIITQAGE